MRLLTEEQYAQVLGAMVFTGRKDLYESIIATNDEYFTKPWSSDDISYVASDHGISLSADQIKKVKRALILNHDAEVGINWESIRVAIAYVLDEELRKSKDEGCIDGKG